MELWSFEMFYVISFTEPDCKKNSPFFSQANQIWNLKEVKLWIQWMASQKDYNFQVIGSSVENLVCFMWVHRRNLFAKRLKFWNNHFELRNFGAFWVISLTASVRKNVELWKQANGAVKFWNILCNFFHRTGSQKIHLFLVKLTSLAPERGQVMSYNDWLRKKVIIFKGLIQALRFWFVSCEFIDGICSRKG